MNVLLLKKIYGYEGWIFSGPFKPVGLEPPESPGDYTSVLPYKTTVFSGCRQGPDHRTPPPRVDGSLNDSQHGLVFAEQVQLKGLGLWNFKKGTNTNIPEIN